MRNNNRRLVILVASVAVAAVAIGAAIAYRQGPQNASADAAPLTGSPSPTPSPSQTPKPSTTPTPSTPTPTAKPTTTPPKPPSGPVKSEVKLDQLKAGRLPQVAYLTGRTVRGGAGQEVKIPGTQDIQRVARMGQSVLAVVGGNDNTTEMLTIGSDGAILRRTPNVTGIVTTEDGMAAAYNTTLVSDLGEQSPGTTIYAEQERIQKVTVPDVWNTTLIGYSNGKVYFQASAKEAASTWTLYSWTPGASKVTAIKTVPKPTAVSADGTVAASLTTLTDYNSCTSVLAVASGKRLWRTCDYQVDGFTPDGTTAIAGPFYRDGYADGIAAALDAKAGTLLHEWSGVFRQTVAEDDQHLLILADTGEESPASIIRCTITTGACELATPLAKGTLLLGS
ncbi:hypothetical protein [Kribbella sp. CA-247076]|uniref:hypothetical protein n=1 Tax=Kribbella sp. CA-247076 TaxID=3239941 RepID=UPI003D8E49CF